MSMLKRVIAATAASCTLALAAEQRAQADGGASEIVVRAEGPRIAFDRDIGHALEGNLPEAVERLERRMIADALAEARGNRSLAARRLGIHRQLLYSKLAQYGME